MRRVLLALLIIAAIAPSVTAEYAVIDRDDLLAPFRTSTGTCRATGYVEPEQAIIAGVSAITNQPWPALNGACGGYNDNEYLYKNSGNRNVVIETATTYTANARAELVGFASGDYNYDYYRSTARQIGETPMNHAILNSYSRDSYNNLAGISAEPVLHDLLWCGEAFNAEFSVTTLTPTNRISGEPLLQASDYQDCRNMWRDLVNEQYGDGTYGSTVDQRGDNAFYYTANSRPYTFPIPVRCSSYDVQIYYHYDVSHSSNNLATSQRAQMEIAAWHDPSTQTKPEAYAYNWEDNRGNFEARIELTVNETGYPEEITYQLDHNENGGGGLGIRIICDGLIDPDANSTYCTSPWRWNETVNTHPQNTPPQACCGDDGDDDLGNQVGGFTCTRNNNVWGWAPPNAQCISGNCCLGAANESRVLMDGDEMKMCLNSTSGWAWRSASTDTNNYTIGAGTAQATSVVSDGTQWIVCQNTLTNTTRTFTRATVDSGSEDQNDPVAPSNRQATPYCGSMCSSCDGDEALDQQCIIEGGTSPACDECARREAQSTCEPDPYYCPSPDLACFGAQPRCGCENQGLVWDGTACVEPACPEGYEYSTTSALCEPPETESSEETGTIALPALGVCNTVVNDATETTNEYICTGAWTPYSPNTAYGLEEAPAGSGRYARVSDPRENADIFCTANGYEVPTRVPSQDRLREGACGTNQCYFSPNNMPSDLENIFIPEEEGEAGYASRCVQSGEWVLDYYCDAGNWTTRSQLLADTLITLLEDDYIVHCDAYNKSLNDPVGARDFATQAIANEVPRTNGYCSVYDASLPGAPLVAVGTTLNGVNGISLTQLPNSDDFSKGEDDILFKDREGDVTGTLFTDLIDDPRLRAANGACDNIKALSIEQRRVNEFYRCNTLPGRGNVFYNPKTSTLVFTTADITEIEPARGTIDGRMQELASAVPRPLAGTKIYVAKNGNREVVAVVQAEGPIGQGRSVGRIVYNAIDVAQHYARRFSAEKSWTRNNNLVTIDFKSTDVDSAGQNDWEYFTLQIRP